MNKGDRTQYGVFLGEVIAQRPQQISLEDATEAFDAIESARDISIVKDPDNPNNDFSTSEEAKEGAIEFLRSKTVCYQFEDDEGNKHLLPVEKGAPEVIEEVASAPEDEPVPSDPEPELGTFIDA